MVTVPSAKKYEIVIDGRQYFSNGNAISISNLFNGQHDIKVFKVHRGFQDTRLVASCCFQLRNNDMQIDINRLGQIQISESSFGHDWDNHFGYRGQPRQKILIAL
jgi:hypothetical protein